MFVTLFACLMVVAVAASASASDLLVQTTLGPVNGHLNGAGVREWKGIRYAKAPSGALRWEYPQSPAPSSSTYEANYDAPGCPQHCNLPPGNCPAYGQSEDCLFLTVMAPTKPSVDPAGYPVFFWIHGGAYEQGLGNCALYNGTYFAMNDVVTVVINYRLGALGYMAASNMQGNYGIMDQRLAMQWTKDNIAGFGGNPGKVTIGGQSAGGMSVGIHLVAPKSKGLFQQSIIESYPYGIPFHDRTTASANANSMMEYLGCAKNDVACMRAKTVDEVLDAQDNSVKLNARNLFINFLPFAPLIDPNGEVPEQPLFAMAKGNLMQTPTLTGTVKDEGQLFVWELFTKPLNRVSYYATIDGLFGSHAGAIKDLYPFNLVNPKEEDGRNVLNMLGTDLLFLCPLRNVTRGYHAALGNSAIPTYGYHFEHKMSFDCWGANYTFCLDSVCHGSELPFVFNVFSDGVITYNPTSAEKDLSTDMYKAWSNFIQNGNPNTGLAVPVAYPLYETVSDTLVVLNEPGMKTVSGFRDQYCDLFDQIGFFW